MKEKKDKKSIRERMNDYHFGVYNVVTGETTHPFRKEGFDIRWLKYYGHPDYYCGIWS